MTHSQALQEAKNRWGENSKIEQMVQKKTNARQSKHSPRVDIEYRVGMTKMQPGLGSVFVVKGIGHTWEEAFHDADRVKPVR